MALLISVRLILNKTNKIVYSSARVLKKGGGGGPAVVVGLPKKSLLRFGDRMFRFARPKKSLFTGVMAGAGAAAFEGGASTLQTTVKTHKPRGKVELRAFHCANGNFMAPGMRFISMVTGTGRSVKHRGKAR